MRVRFGAALASALTITVGVAVVFGLLLSDEFGVYTITLPTWLPDFFPDQIELAPIIDGLQGAADVLLQLVTITVALTVLIGVLNLLLVHSRRLITRQKSALYSAVLVLSFVGVVVTYLSSRDDGLVLLETVLVSVESALAGLLLFTLVYGAARMMRRNVTWTSILFIAALLVVLVGALPLPGVTIVQDIRTWLLEIPVSAGARGILLGIALATIVTGIRVLIGVDKSYRE